MHRSFLLLVLLCFTAFGLKAQKTIVLKKDSSVKKLDTIKKPEYVNPGKIAGKKAAFRSMIVPGLGQIGNGVTIYRLAKVAGIYVGGTFLTLSYIQNNANYHTVLEELQYRSSHDDQPNPQSIYAGYQTDGLIPAKDTFRRNREIVIFSFVGLYLLNVVEAYIDARLKYFNVDDIAIKISPDVINTNTMYGVNQITPGIKLTFNF